MAQDLFQSTRPRGARRGNSCECRYLSKVSIHAPAWGATRKTLTPIDTISGFNPRARVGRDSIWVKKDSNKFCFNPRARVGRDEWRKLEHLSSQMFQSTRPRGARPKMPTCRPWCSPPVSIHAPAWGATRKTLTPIDTISGFNPRARVGRDSIWVKKDSNKFCFNPRARVGRDEWRKLEHLSSQMFQSTRPRGARPKMPTCRPWCSPPVSIHAPAWGATCIAEEYSSQYAQFQSTRPRGARPSIAKYLTQGQYVSIHAPAWGATHIL